MREFASMLYVVLYTILSDMTTKISNILAPYVLQVQQVFCYNLLYRLIMPTFVLFHRLTLYRNSSRLFGSTAGVCLNHRLSSQRLPPLSAHQPVFVSMIATKTSINLNLWLNSRYFSRLSAQQPIFVSIVGSKAGIRLNCRLNSRYLF